MYRSNYSLPRTRWLSAVHVAAGEEVFHWYRRWLRAVCGNRRIALPQPLCSFIPQLYWTWPLSQADPYLLVIHRVCGNWCYSRLTWIYTAFYCCYGPGVLASIDPELILKQQNSLVRIAIQCKASTYQDSKRHTHAAVSNCPAWLQVQRHTNENRNINMLSSLHLTYTLT
jgi:hypothetical protein